LSTKYPGKRKIRNASIRGTR